MEFDKPVGLGQISFLLLTPATHDLCGQYIFSLFLKHTMVSWCRSFLCDPFCPSSGERNGLLNILGPPCSRLAFCICSTLRKAEEKVVDYRRRLSGD